ncbi:MAG: radical SAM protein [Candidatus Altiarchaeota archaeon]
MNYLYGPVPSRRLGSSLGVDLVPCKVCSFDCIYCQLGRTTRKTCERKEYVSREGVIKEISEFLESGNTCDYITLAGSGEPTLHSGIGDIILQVKKLTDIPVAVITNSSLLGSIKLRTELKQADVVLPSLDATSQTVFETINRPADGISSEKMVYWLSSFRKGFEGKLWLEVLMVRGVNDSPEELMGLKQAIKDIRPDKVHINTVTRPSCEFYAQPLNQVELSQIAEVLGGEVIADSNRSTLSKVLDDQKEDLISKLIERRPCTLFDISNALGLHENEAVKYIKSLETRGKIKSSYKQGKRFYGGIV